MCPLPSKHIMLTSTPLESPASSAENTANLIPESKEKENKEETYSENSSSKASKHGRIKGVAKIIRSGAGGAAKRVGDGAGGAVRLVGEGAGNAVKNVGELVQGKEFGTPRNAGFVSFTSLNAKAGAIQMRHHPTPFCLDVDDAPKLEHLFWGNVGLEHSKQQIGKLAAASLTTLLCLFWTVIVR